MSKIGKISIVSAVFLASLVLLSTGVSASADIEHTDATGDVEYVGIEDTQLHDNIDITSLTADTSGDPIILELTTLAGITIEASGMDYSYYLYLDLTGDDSADLTVTINEDDQYISGSIVSGTNAPLSGVSGEGTSTLRVELPLELFTTIPSVDDISAMTDLSDGGYWARDHSNKDFKGDTSEVEITPPSDNEDPGEADPTNPSIGMSIDSFNMEFSTTDTHYDYTIQATGSGSDGIIAAFYSIWAYGGGGGGPERSWEEGPIDEDNSYGDYEYREEFFGTGPEGSWSTWKWTFHSKGPIDGDNKNRFEDPESYWQGLDSMVLYVRGYDMNGDWDQDSEDITEEYTGIKSSSPGDGGNTDDSPGFGIPLLVCSVLSVALFMIGRKRDRVP